MVPAKRSGDKLVAGCGVMMALGFSSRRLLGMAIGGMALAGCVSGAALVPTPRQAQTAPRGAVSVPIGPPVSTATPARAVNAPPKDVVDPGFRRPPSGLSDRIS